MMLNAALITISVQIFQCRSNTHFQYLYQLKTADVKHQSKRMAKMDTRVK